MSETGLMHLGHDPFLDKSVAIKIISKQADELVLSRIQRELRIGRLLSVPGVARIHDLHESQGLRYLIMDYIDGVNLESMLDRWSGEARDIAQAVNWLRQAAELIEQVHKQGVVHGNLKPSKLFIMDDDSLAMLDFTLAKGPGMEAISVAENRPFEALYYTAPELILGQSIGILSDIYSLGAILYRCVTGKSPLETAGPIKSTTGFRGDKPKRPSQLNKQVPKVLEQVILTAISANPSSRYRNGRELLDALNETLDKVSRASRRMRKEGEADTSQPVMITAGDQESTGLRATVEFTTILFSDIVGSTTFFEKHGDLAGRQRIERHNELLFPVIRLHSGTIVKTIGDGIMASFDDEDQAVEAAIGMQKALDAYNRACQEEDAKISIRIGINSGEGIAEYGDVYGDSVNVASRVSSKAKGDQILISETTYKLLTRNRDIVQAMAQVELKGKDGVFLLYQVDWLLSDDPDAVPDLPPDLSDVPDEPDGESTQVVSDEWDQPDHSDHSKEAVLAEAREVVAQTIGQELREEDVSLRTYVIMAGMVLFVMLALVYGLCGSSQDTPPPQGPQPGDISEIDNPNLPKTNTPTEMP
ncbi:MAG: protein kinase [Deltaproteobacteria bacterium]|nr:protein kinase [Deltaproteobacteria bacterium]